VRRLNARRLDHRQLILLVIRDIADRERVDALRAAKEEAEEAREKAEAASLVKSQFLGTMSHKLRTPLNGVMGLTDLRETEVLGPRQRDRRRVSHGSAGRSCATSRTRSRPCSMRTRSGCG
jgi:signal transduction histidine kinase